MDQLRSQQGLKLKPVAPSGTSDAEHAAARQADTGRDPGSVPDDVFDETQLPTQYTDVDLLREHGRERGVLNLGYGETWTQTAPGLLTCLSGPLPLHAHGYLLTPYGLPALRRVLRDRIVYEHRLDAHRFQAGRDFEVAVSQSGTRQTMYDFAQLLATESASRRRPTALVPAPGWDYPSMLLPAGFTVRYLPLRHDNGYQLDTESTCKALHDLQTGSPRSPRLLILNAQHNPTGANWDLQVVRRVIRAALSTGASLLLDDAYYAVHDPGTVPTSALRILLEETAEIAAASDVRVTEPPRWLAVRSLGKQFHCNGWGIGAMTASPTTIEALVWRMFRGRSISAAVPLQAAMAAWLSQPESTLYVQELSARYAERRRRVVRTLVRDLCFPGDLLFEGCCTAYVRIPVPPRYGTGPNSEAGYRHDAVARAGVLLGEASMTPDAPPANQGHVRAYLGHPQHVLDAALERLHQAHLGWDA
jgi:N-succinyldiaminopimelate aminotransferase